MWLGPPWAHRDPGWLRAATRREQPCFAAKCGPDPFGLRVHFSILRLRTQFRAATRKERPCFAAECGFGRLGHTGTLEALEQPHEKNGPVLLQNVAPTPLGTHEHSRVHFSIPVLAVYVERLRNIICRIILPVLAIEVSRNTCTQTSTCL